MGPSTIQNTRGILTPGESQWPPGGRERSSEGTAPRSSRSATDQQVGREGRQGGVRLPSVGTTLRSLPPRSPSKRLARPQLVDEEAHEHAVEAGFFVPVAQVAGAGEHLE